MTSLEEIFAASGGRAEASLPAVSGSSDRDRAVLAIVRRRRTRATVVAATALVLLGGAATGTWAALDTEPALPQPSPSASEPVGPVTDVPGVPNADVQFRPLIETYPSVWGVLGSTPMTVRVDDWRYITGPDGSLPFVEAREDGWSRISLRAGDGTETPLTDWLPTDRGQQWWPLAFDGRWLAYADEAGSHTDGPTTGPGIFLLNVETGETSVVAERAFSAPREPCDECGYSGYYTTAHIAGGRLYWIHSDIPGGSIYDQVLRSRALEGGTVVDHLTGDQRFADPSCVTTPGANVRVTGTGAQSESLETLPTLAWDVGASSTTRVPPEEGLTAQGNQGPSACGRVQITSWLTPLDGRPLSAVGISGNPGDPPELLNAIDIFDAKTRARIRLDDDFGDLWVTSSINGWTVIRIPHPWVDDFYLLDTTQWDLYAIDAPPAHDGEGAWLVLYASVHDGRLWVEVDHDLSEAEDYLYRTAIVSVALD